MTDASEKLILEAVETLELVVGLAQLFHVPNAITDVPGNAMAPFTLRRNHRWAEAGGSTKTSPFFCAIHMILIPIQ